MRLSIGVTVLLWAICGALFSLFFLLFAGYADDQDSVKPSYDLPSTLSVLAMKEAKLYHELRCIQIPEPDPLAGEYCITYETPRK